MKYLNGEELAEYVKERQAKEDRLKGAKLQPKLATASESSHRSLLRKSLSVVPDGPPRQSTFNFSPVATPAFALLATGFLFHGFSFPKAIRFAGLAWGKIIGQQS